jgi:hypothetical protein
VSLRTGWRLYAVYGVDNPATAARGVALRYAELRDSHPRSELIVRALS